ncbi:TetR/AcrR family transcriptional regulator [Xanthobacter dioxanivorans]|uniref:TetR/AcrR family transcriptional regulator n=1 Tax=Xanthobacter dioxanivorans TaxID=2528964 RepID=A0A974PP07_9HYPH|nr:TetR/AcrR family transcriptional regulator [Xanthobacter dioxanivorans]QRG07124.1 TetR/AcrR family transcriptional regulator [Xanthobacter dioxanivorans]
MAKTVAERSDILPALGEVFREHGFEGASLAHITARTGLGKGSLYHFFPGGKEEMAAAVLAEIDGWFETHVYAPLRTGADAAAGVRDMLAQVDAYFRSGRRVCLVGVFALGEVRDRFSDAVLGYFARWRDALAQALGRAGLDPDTARGRAEDAVLAIQGALVLARALDDTGVFTRALARLEHRLLAPG